MTDKATDKSDMNDQNTLNSNDLSALFNDIDSDFGLDSVLGSSGHRNSSIEVDLFSRTDSLSGSLDAVLENAQKDGIDLDIDFSDLADGTGIKEPTASASAKKDDAFEVILDDLGASFDLAAIEVSDDLDVSSADDIENVEVIDDFSIEDAKDSSKSNKKIESSESTSASHDTKPETSDHKSDALKETLSSQLNDKSEVESKASDASLSSDQDDENDIALQKTADLAVLEAEDLEEGGEVRLSTRAKLGREIRIEDVVEAYNEVKEDFLYSEEDCAAVEDPELYEQNVKRGLVSTIVGVIIVGIIVVVGVHLYQRSVNKANTYAVAQNFGFTADSLRWKEFDASPNGKWIAVCNDTRGAVYHSDKLVAQFFPKNGCQGIQVSEDGKHVTYVTNNSQLERFILDKDLGFNNGSLVGSLPGLASNAFSAENDGSVSYITRDNLSINVVRHTNLEDVTQSLPEDALVCFGSKGYAYAYISKLEMHIHREGQPDIVASLDDPKLACPREVALGCSYDGTDLWAAVCQNGYVQGKGTTSIHGQYNFTNVATGADFVSLYRHTGGTEIVTPEKWLRISDGASSELSEVALSHRIDGPAVFAWRDSETQPLIGIANGLLTRIGDKGSVSQSADNGNGRQLAASFFANAGNNVVNVFNGMNESGEADGSSYLAFWDPSKAQFVKQSSLPGTVSAVGVSQSGMNGFVVLETASKDASKSTFISFIQWKQAAENITDKLEISGTPVYAEWSDNEKNCIIKYDDGRSEMYMLVDDKMEKVAELQAGVDVAFHSNDYLWVLEYENSDKPRLRMFSIAENQYGVDFSIAENAIAKSDVKHISASPYSSNLLLWGESGLWTYDVSLKKITQKLDQPVTWLSFSHSGKSVATNLGIVDFASKDVRHQVYPENVSPLLWSSDDSYLQNADSSQIFNVTGNQKITLPGRAQGIAFLGQGAGLHPSAPLALSLRSDLTTIHEVTASSTDILAAFTGTGENAWCWLAPNGEAQGNGSICSPLEKYNREDIAAPVSTNNAAVLSSASALANVATITHEPVAPIDFVDSTRLVVKAIPADAQVLFSDSNGERPDALVSKDEDIAPFMHLPFETTLKVSDLGYSAVFIAAGYEMLVVPFNADSAEVVINAQLLKSSYKDIAVSRHNSQDSLSNETTIAIQSFVGNNRDDIKKCADSPEQSMKLTLDVTENCSIVLSNEFTANPCLEAAFDEFKQPRSCATTSGLAENAFESFDVVLP